METPEAGLAGGCHCTAVRYTCAETPESAFYCHCTDCQRLSGSPFSVEVMVDRDALQVTGPLRAYAMRSETGDEVSRWHCAQCLSAIYLEARSDPRHVFVKVGSMDDASGVRPRMHIFARHLQPWLVLDDGLPRFDAYPT